MAAKAFSLFFILVMLFRCCCFFLFQPKKRRLTPDSGLSEGKRQRKDEEASERTKEEEDEEERIAEEKLKQLQDLAKKSVTEKPDSSGSLTSPSSSKACRNSSWQQMSTLMIYTAAGVKASDKVRPSLLMHLYCIIYVYR